jgi:hypothetical protein
MFRKEIIRCLKRYVTRERPVETIVSTRVASQIGDQPLPGIHIEVVERGRELVGETAIVIIAHAVVLQNSYPVVAWQVHPCQVARPAIKGAVLAGAGRGDAVVRSGAGWR